MKIKFESDDDLPLGKTFSIFDMVIVGASVLEKKTINIIHNFVCLNTRIIYKNVTIQKS